MGVPQAPPPHPGVPMGGPPPRDVPPRFCQNHFTSAQREKIDPCQRPCERCGTQITSTYAQMTFCPPCSNELERCMICGNGAPVASNYIPPKTLGSQQQAGMVYAKPIEPEDPSLRHAPSPHRSRPCGCGGAATLPSPPPPPTMGPASRIAADFDLDWAFGGSSPTWNQAPPSPPPPPSNRGKQVPLAGAPRGGASPPPMKSGQGAHFHDQAARMGSGQPAGDLVRSHKQRPQAHFNLDPAVDRGADKDGTWQGMYTLATDRLDQMLDYLGTFQLPGMDMNQWSTCMNSSDQHDISEFREGSRSPQKRQPRHAQMQRA
ncbi:unnamed protein product [Symbiodinium microadriaticum]|nr:unnamed protein product [Symbiodinium microadriaticum]